MPWQHTFKLASEPTKHTLNLKSNDHLFVDILKTATWALCRFMKWFIGAALTMALVTSVGAHWHHNWERPA